MPSLALKLACVPQTGHSCVMSKEAAGLEKADKKFSWTAGKQAQEEHCVSSLVDVVCCTISCHDSVTK
jgi:hypothetical protein